MLEYQGTHRYVNALAVAAALAALLCAANHVIVTSTADAHRYLGSVLMSVFVLPLQVSLVGAVTIREVRPRTLQYYLYGAIITALDVQLFVTAVLHPAAVQSVRGTGHILYLVPAAAMVAGQIALVVVGVMFGTGNWRWPLAIATSAWIGFWWLLIAMQRPTAIWVQIILLELVALILLCVQLRGWGFHLSQVAGILEGKPSSRSQPLQFGLRHMLTLISVCAICLGMARAAGMLRMDALMGYVFSDIVFMISIAILTAMMLVVTFWATLGQGSTVLRAVLFLVVLVFAGSCASWYATHRTPIPSPLRDLQQWRALGWEWWLWFASAGGILAALLLFVRGLGFRLVRRARQQNAPAVSPDG
jgi:hypothetical protein